MAWWNWGKKVRAVGTGRQLDVVAKTAAMVGDQAAQSMVKRHGLQILDVTWEDAGRSKGSCWGPNISDMTIQVEGRDGRGRPSQCMPVIRAPNFSDRTGDVPMDLLSVMVGNEKGEGLRRVPLRDVLSNLRSYLHDSSSWAGTGRSLLAPERDSHVLVSPQACFLPIPEGGEAKFNPVLFNYQSSQGAPAVLTLLATREGTSITIIDNARDGFSTGGSWGQRLFFNSDGERASLTGTRKSEFLADAANADPSGAAGQDREGLNLVMLFQIPLKVVRPRYDDVMFSCASEAAPALDMLRCRSGGSDVEEAVIGHGEVEGPFTEIAGLRIERDERFPIRATVQFYQATSNGVISEQDVARFAEQIARVYEDADYVGSLVVEGETERPTEPLTLQNAYTIRNRS